MNEERKEKLVDEIQDLLRRQKEEEQLERVKVAKLAEETREAIE